MGINHVHLISFTNLFSCLYTEGFVLVHQLFDFFVQTWQKTVFFAHSFVVCVHQGYIQLLCFLDFCLLSKLGKRTYICFCFLDCFARHKLLGQHKGCRKMGSSKFEFQIIFDFQLRICILYVGLNLTSIASIVKHLSLKLNIFHL